MGLHNVPGGVEALGKVRGIISIIGKETNFRSNYFVIAEKPDPVPDSDSVNPGSTQICHILYVAQSAQSVHTVQCTIVNTFRTLRGGRVGDGVGTL
jgi:hypothetical protein